MGWSRPDEDSRADHYRDEHNHELRPGDRGFPLRLETAPLSTALDIALCVRSMKNPQEAAELIERYVGARAAEVRMEAVAAGANA